jgi:hypothetical protein
MLTESQYASLLNAVPSFAPKWAASQASLREYVERFPEDTWTDHEIAVDFYSQFASHVGEQVASGDRPEEMPRLVVALEKLYESADEELWGQLTIGFLESVIFTIDRLGKDSTTLAALMVGPETRHAWRIAYEEIHPPEGGRRTR